MSHAVVTLVGNVGGDPASRQVNDRRVVNFTMATTRRKGQEKVTQWWNIACWEDKLGDVILDYVRKGHQVMVEGDVTPRLFENTRSGKTEVSMDVDISFRGRLVLLNNRDKDEDERPSRGGRDRDDDRRDARKEREPARREPAKRRPAEDLDDDIPF